MASAPAVENGELYASVGMDVYALPTADGSQLWTVHFSKLLPSPVVADGTVYLAMQDQLIALATVDGTVRWQLAKPGAYSYPA